MQMLKSTPEKLEILNESVISDEIEGISTKTFQFLSENRIISKSVILEGPFLSQTPFSCVQMALKEPNKIITLSRRLIWGLRNNSSSRRITQV